jgi:O-antigen/teichoic acid export membrane protein
MSLESTKHIKISALISYFTIAFSIISGLIYTPWMVRQIGKSDYGIFMLVTSFLTYFVMDFGLGQAIARFIAKYRVEGNEAKINELLGLTARLYLWINLIIVFTLVVVFFFIENIFKELSATEVQSFKVVYCIAGFFSIVSFPFTPLNGILIAYERFVLLKLCDLFNKIGLIILMIIALLMGYKLYSLIAINAGVGLIIILIKLFYLSKTTAIKIDFTYKSKELFRELFSFSIWITVIGIAQRLLMNITPTILGIYSGTVSIAVFSIGMIIEGYTYTFSSALSGLFLPRVSALSIKKDNMTEISNLMIRIGRIQLFMVGLLLVGIITLGKQFITLWMGPDFEDSYYVALFLIIPGIVTLTQEIGSTLLYVVNELKYRAFLFIGASTVSVIISVILAPKYGAIGSAIGICVATILCHIMGMNIVYWKVAKIDIPRFFRECYMKMLPPLGLSLVTGFLIQVYIPAHNLLTFIPKAALLGIIYILLMWSIGLNKEEKLLIQSLVLKIVPGKKI